MFDSKKYWNNRYLKGQNSGSGSYNHLAEFKASIINNFIKKNEIDSIIDYGVGDGNQLKLINTNNIIYTGIDINEFIISKCKQLFKNDINKTFILEDDIINNLKAELGLSCDVIYHLIEDDIYEKYMNNLFSMSNKYIIIYAKDEDKKHSEHVKFRKFTSYIERNFQDWELIEHIPNKYPQLKLGNNNDKTSPSDFYIYKKILKKIKNRESKLLGEPSNILRLNYIYEILDKLNLKKGSRILDFGGNQFSEYCKKNNLNYTMLDLEKQQDNGTGGYFPGGITYDGVNIPFPINSFEVIICSFVLHHTSSNCINLLKQLKKITKNYLIVCEDLCGIEYPIKWHERCFKHQKEGIFRCDEEWKFIFESLSFNLIDILNIRCQRDKEFSDPYEHIYRIQYTLSKNISSKKINLSFQIPVYISLTSIFKNQYILLKTLKSIIVQTRKPEKIFLYLSEEPYILDDGFKDKKITNQDLLKFINDNPIIVIKWVKNEGPYRKLLPLLKDKWEEDCIIITIDDDTIYTNDLINNLVNDYYKQKCIICYRGFTLEFDKIENIDYKKRKKLVNNSLYNFATGKGGILYKPEFFHKTKNLIFNDKIYLNTCDKQDDIWFYLVRILNNIKCYVGLKKWHTKDISSNGLWVNYNSKKNNNTIAFQNTIKKLKELEYNF